MVASPPCTGRFRAATCRRWGCTTTLARAARAAAPRHFFIRLARRTTRDRTPPLPLAVTIAPADGGAASLAAAPTAPATLALGVEPPASLSPPPAPAKRWVSKSDAGLAVCPSLIARAEARSAPALFADLTDEGRSPVTRAMAGRVWTSPYRARLAETFARSLDLLPRERCPPAWSHIVCGVAAVIFEELCPAFAQVRSRAAELGSHFSLVPMRGKHGWIARARWAGLLGAPIDAN